VEVLRSGGHRERKPSAGLTPKGLRLAGGDVSLGIVDRNIVAQGKRQEVAIRREPRRANFRGRLNRGCIFPAVLDATANYAAM
jgi:hypothetical protein